MTPGGPGCDALSPSDNYGSNNYGSAIDANATTQSAQPQPTASAPPSVVIAAGGTTSNAPASSGKPPGKPSGPDLAVTGQAASARVQLTGGLLGLVLTVAIFA
jgi:hypothetical protein